MAKTALPPPMDAKTLERLLEEKKRDFKDQDEEIDLLRQVREMKDDVVLPARFTQITSRDPTVANEQKRVTSSLSLNLPHCTVTLRDDAPDSQQGNATLRETFYEEVLDYASRCIEGQNARVEAIDNCLMGGAWVKFLFYNDLWEERYKPRGKEDYSAYETRTEQAKKDAGPPFVMISVDPRTVYPIWTGTKLAGMLEVTERPVHETLLEYGLTVDGTDRVGPNTLGQGMSDEQAARLPQKVKFIEYWDQYRCYYWLVGIGKEAYPLRVFEHGLGRVPYFPAFGFKMGHWRNRKVGWGVSQTKRFLVQAQTFMQTMLIDSAARDTYTPVVHVLGEQSAQARQLLGEDGKPQWSEDFKAELREILIAYPGDAWEAYPVRDVAQSLTEAIKLNREMIQDDLTPRVTSQIGASGLEGAGYATATVIAEGKIENHPYVNNLEEMYENLTRFIDWLIINRIKEKVWVYAAPSKKGKGGYIGVGPDDLKNPVKIKWDIDPERPTAKLIEGRYYIEQKGAGFIGPEQAIREQGRNPDEVRRDILKGQVRADPRYMQWQLSTVAEEMGLGQIFAMNQMADQVAANGTNAKGTGFPGQEQNPAAQGPNQSNLAAAPGGQAPDNGNTGLTNGPTVPQAAGSAGMQ